MPLVVGNPDPFGVFSPGISSGSQDEDSGGDDGGEVHFGRVRKKSAIITRELGCIGSEEDMWMVVVDTREKIVRGNSVIYIHQDSKFQGFLVMHPKSHGAVRPPL